jgi:SAM-dependent methyltransferase
VAISRFGVMFFGDPTAGFANLARGLRPGGRLVFVCWQGLVDHEWVTVPAGAAAQHVPLPSLTEPGGPGPFSLSDRHDLAGMGYGAPPAQQHIPSTALHLDLTNHGQVPTLRRRTR